MKIRHQNIGGKCVFCGAKNKHEDLLQPAGETSPPPPDSNQSLDPDDDIYNDCSQARFYLIRFFFLLMMPILFFAFGWQFAILALGAGGLFFKFLLTAEDAKWVGLRDLREEYEGLLNSIPSRKKSYYIKHLDTALYPLFTMRDKAFKAQALIFGDPVEEIELKINQIREKSQNMTDPDLIEMYRNQLKDLNENRKKVEQIQSFLEKFETNKNCVIQSIKLLRNRILVTEAGDDEAEELKILEDLKSLHYIYEKVNNPKTDQKKESLTIGSFEEPESETPEPPKPPPEKTRE